jgi:hypothetical protein
MYEESVITPRIMDVTCHAEPQDAMQQEALHFLSATGKYEKFDHHRQRVLALQTGKGKTFCFIKHIAETGRMGLVTFYKEPLIKKWKDDIFKFSNIQDDEIAIVSGRDSLKKIMKNREKYKIILAIHRTFSNMINSDSDEGAKEVNAFFKYMGVGIKGYDEAHIEMQSTFLLDTTVDVEETVYLTATPSRGERTSEDRIFSWMLPRWEVCFGNQEWLKREKYHDIFYAKFDSNPSTFWKDEMVAFNEKARQKGLSIAVYSNYIEEVTYPIFFNIITRYISGLRAKKSDIPIAILVHLNVTAKRMYEDLCKIYKNSVGLFNGTIPPDKREEQLAYPIVVTNAKMFKDGLDTPVEAILNTIPMGGDVPLEQTIGRLRGGEGMKAIYIDITDVGFQKSKQQFVARRKFIDDNLASRTAVKDLTDEEWIYAGFHRPSH